MTSAIKTFVVLVLMLPLLIYIGSEIGNDDYLIPIIAGVLMFVSLIFGLFFRGQRVESLLLSMLLGGYIIGNRGFAQIYLVQPLFMGELVMMALLAMMIFRFATAREFIVPHHLLARLIVCYLAFAFLRLCFDWGTYGIDAVRDSAIAYYALFFFAAYQLGRRAEAADFMDRRLIAIFFLQSIVVAIASFQPEWLDLVTIRGTSPLLQKADIAATFSTVGIFFVTVRPDLVRARWLRLLLLGLLLVCILLSGARAALVAMGGALVLTWVAARRGFIALPLFIGTLAVAGTLIFGADPNSHLATTRDQVISVTDVSGTYHYQTDVGTVKQADNAFRRALWDSIYQHTVQDNAWLAGKGFGYNFIPDFEREYHAGTWESLRSAHNFYVTVFGRLGLIGLILFVGISIEIIRHGLRAALALRRGERQDAQALAYWCGVWAILISGTFGVVLEGPMGAIIFWSMLGFALASSDRFELARKADAAEPSPVALPVSRLAQLPGPRPVRVG